MRGLQITCIGILALAATAIVLRVLVIKIEPGQAGVLNAEWTGGLVEKDYDAGYHWNLGPLHTWEVWDTTVQTMHMVSSRQQGHGDVHDALTVKSTEGADVTLDVTIKYQIEPGKAWQVQTAEGPGNRYRNRVFNIARDVMRIALGGLGLEAFYEASSRQTVQDEMQTTLSKRLSEKHIKLVSILIRDVAFEARFQSVINDKTIATQDKEKSIALARVAEAEGRTRKIEAETGAKTTVITQQKETDIIGLRATNDKTIAAIIADYERKVTETKSDGDLYAAQREAEGILVLKEAEADGQSLKRDALASSGGRVLIALEVVRNLQLGEMIVSTQQINPLDINEMMNRLGTANK